MIILEIHLVVAFFVALCAVIFSWNSMGRRVMNAVTGLQFLVGLITAGILGANHIPMQPAIGAHAASALLAMVCYIFARREGDRAGGSRRAMVLSVLGVVFVFISIYLGLHMAGKM